MEQKATEKYQEWLGTKKQEEKVSAINALPALLTPQATMNGASLLP